MKSILLTFLLLFSINSFAGSTSEVNCLTAAIYKEARSEPLKCQQAVAEVIMNRAEHPGYPDSICKVIKQPKQFSWWDNSEANRKLLKGSTEGLNKLDMLAYQEAKQIALLAYTGLLEGHPALEDSLHFATLETSNKWIRKKRVKMLCQNHKFM